MTGLSYSTIGILAIIVHLIVNLDIFLNRDADVVPAQDAYRRFLFGILVYYITDVLWGIFERTHLTTALYLDTTVYFVAMVAAVLLWTQYVVTYLEVRGRFSRLLSYAGRIFFVAELGIVAINWFYPILFWFEPNGTYHAEWARYATLGFQIVMFLMASAYAFLVTRRTAGALTTRYRTIGFFGLAMVVLIAFQILYPLLPLYSMGYMIGSCLLHTLVLEDEKDEYRRELEEALRREQRQQEELVSARYLAYTDPLTGVKSKHAYVEAEELMSRRISGGEVSAFGVVVFDLNGLKHINDTLGHETGDAYIVEASQLICRQFMHSPVYRIGGDEFLALLEGEDYDQRQSLVHSFDQLVESNLREGRVVISTGMAEYREGVDNDFQSVFERADVRMYRRKESLKSMGAVTRG